MENLNNIEEIEDVEEEENTIELAEGELIEEEKEKPEKKKYVRRSKKELQKLAVDNLIKKNNVYDEEQEPEIIEKKTRKKRKTKEEIKTEVYEELKRKLEIDPNYTPSLPKEKRQVTIYQRTQKQIDAFKKARETRAKNLEKKKNEAEETVKKQFETIMYDVIQKEEQRKKERQAVTQKNQHKKRLLKIASELANESTIQQTNTNFDQTPEQQQQPTINWDEIF